MYRAQASLIMSRVIVDELATFRLRDLSKSLLLDLRTPAGRKSVLDRPASCTSDERCEYGKYSTRMCATLVGLETYVPNQHQKDATRNVITSAHSMKHLGPPPGVDGAKPSRGGTTPARCWHQGAGRNRAQLHLALVDCPLALVDWRNQSAIEVCGACRPYAHFPHHEGVHHCAHCWTSDGSNLKKSWRSR